MWNDMLMQMLAQRQKMQGQPPVGMAPPNQPPFQMPTAGNHMMQPGLLGAYGQQAQGMAGGLLQQTPGTYGAQAQQLAGLLGSQGQPPVGMAPPYQPGRFMPGFRPGIDQPITDGSGRAQGSPRRRIQEY